MKKNRILRVAAFLLIAVMITTCTISGTFAKYVTADDGSATARVAKWGVDVAVQAGKGADDANDAFATNYDNEASATGTKVVSNSTDNVLAPGTKGTLATVSVSGTPEVMVDVKVDVNLELVNWKVGGVDYCPLVITVGSTEITNITDAEALEAAVEEAVIKALTADDQTITTDGTGKTATMQYDANSNLAKTLTVTWEWAFETGADDAAKAANDVKDTALGDAAATGTAATVSFDIKVTVTQVD